MIWGFKISLPHLKENGSILVIDSSRYRSCCSYNAQLRNTESLVEKYGNDELVIIDSNYEDKEDETLVGFMPFHLISEIE